MDSMRHIAVVDSSFAGLPAANLLFNLDCSVSVVGTWQRVGGRVWSKEMPNGAIVELGAAWISSDDHTVTKMAEHLNLSHREMILDQFLRMHLVPGYARYRAPYQSLYLGGAARHSGEGIRVSTEKMPLDKL